MGFNSYWAAIPIGLHVYWAVWNTGRLHELLVGSVAYWLCELPTAGLSGLLLKQVSCCQGAWPTEMVHVILVCSVAYNCGLPNGMVHDIHVLSHGKLAAL